MLPLYACVASVAAAAAESAAQIEFVKKLLEKQHGIDPRTVAYIDFFNNAFSKFK